MQQQQQTPGSAAAVDPVSAALAAAAGLTTPQQQRESLTKVAADLQQPQQQQQYMSFPRVVQSPLPPLWNAQIPPPALLPLPPVQPLAGPLLRVFGSAPPGQPYALAKALCDSGKLTALDQLLVKLKAEGHRVLVFCQVRVGCCGSSSRLPAELFAGFCNVERCDCAHTPRHHVSAAALRGLESRCYRAFAAVVLDPCCSFKIHRQLTGKASCLI
jgi:hypothetical protein